MSVEDPVADPVDVVLLDLSLRDSAGLDALHRVRAAAAQATFWFTMPAVAELP